VIKRSHIQTVSLITFKTKVSCLQSRTMFRQQNSQGVKLWLEGGRNSPVNCFKSCPTLFSTCSTIGNYQNQVMSQQMSRCTCRTYQTCVVDIKLVPHVHNLNHEQINCFPRLPDAQNMEDKISCYIFTRLRNKFQYRNAHSPH
jgi:hypothetical protein